MMFSAESETGEYIDHMEPEISQHNAGNAIRTWHTGITEEDSLCIE